MAPEWVQSLQARVFEPNNVHNYSQLLMWDKIEILPSNTLFG